MAADEKTATLTEYVVLKFPPPPAANTASGVQQGFKEVKRIQASSSDVAIRTVAEKEGAGTYVAVPARSWQPRTVEVEQTTKVSFKEQT